jgi:hypothetical protein
MARRTATPKTMKGMQGPAQYTSPLGTTHHAHAVEDGGQEAGDLLWVRLGQALAGLLKDLQELEVVLSSNCLPDESRSRAQTKGLMFDQMREGWWLDKALR